MSTATPLRPQPWTIAAIALSGLLAGGLIGGVTNAINGAVSPTYFVNILGWQDVNNVWRASIAQGIFEGLLFGLLFSLIFTITTARITRGTCPFGFAFRHLLGIVAGIVGCWIVGGLAALGLATLSPEFFRHAFIGVPTEFRPLLAYAWVGGSIWGAIAGGLGATLLGLLALNSNWQRRPPHENLD